MSAFSIRLVCERIPKGGIGIDNSCVDAETQVVVVTHSRAVLEFLETVSVADVEKDGVAVEIELYKEFGETRVEGASARGRPTAIACIDGLLGTGELHRLRGGPVELDGLDAEVADMVDATLLQAFLLHDPS